MYKNIYSILFILTVMQFGCTSKSDLIGKYYNKSNHTVKLILYNNETYELVENDQVFNKGKWSFENEEGYNHVKLFNWKDLPNFNLTGCKDKCYYVEVTYYGKELIFNSDDYSINFIKIDL